MDRVSVAMNDSQSDLYKQICMKPLSDLTVISKSNLIKVRTNIHTSNYLGIFSKIIDLGNSFD